MASKLSRSLPADSQANLNAQSETTSGASVPRSSNCAEFLQLQYDMVSKRNGSVKEESQTEQHYLAETKDFCPGTFQRQYVDVDSIQDVFPKSSFLIHGGDYAESSSYYTTEQPSLSRGPGFLSSPPSSGMPSPENCWKIIKDELGSHRRLETTNLSIGVDKMHVLFPPGPTERATIGYQDNVLQSGPGDTAGKVSSRQDIVSTAQETVRHKCHNSNQSNDGSLETEFINSMSELAVSTLQESRQCVDVSNNAIPEDESMSDTEPGNGDCLNGRDILGYVWDQRLNGIALDNPAMEPHDLALVRETFIEQIMTTFPVFDPNWTTNFTNSTGSESNSPASNRASMFNKQSSSDPPSSSHGRKRSRDDEDDESADGNSGAPNNLRPSSGGRHSRQLTSRLACPFRKRDPEKYNLQEYRVCATKPWDTISRLKQHLYTVHRAAIYCLRCKDVFETHQDLEAHINVPRSRSCEQQDLAIPDGMTPAMEVALRGRWQSSTPQVFWCRIYQILFPNEIVPSPDFDQILDMPPARTSPAPRVEMLPRSDPQYISTSREDADTDNTNISFIQCIILNFPEYLESCRLKSSSSCTTGKETSKGLLSTRNLNNPIPDNSSLHDSKGKQRDWESTCSNSSPSTWEHIQEGQRAQSDTLAPFLHLSSVMTHDLHNAFTDSNSSICLCPGRCTCSGLIGSDLALPTSGLHAAEFYERRNETPTWDDEFVDMAVLGSSSLEVDD